MAESTRYQRITLHMSSPWNEGNVTSHEWAVKFSLSGASNVPTVDAEATALDLWDPIKQLVAGHTSLIAWDHYPIGSATHDQNMAYPPATHVGSASAWSTGGPNQQLEVCVLATCPVGESSKGRPVFLRKWIHDVQNKTTDLNAMGGLASAATLFDKWNHGCGPHNLVPVSPTTGVQGGPWTAENHLFTHQLRRGPKKKVAGTSAISAVEDALTQVIKDVVIGKLAGGLPVP